MRNNLFTVALILASLLIAIALWRGKEHSAQSIAKLPAAAVGSEPFLNTPPFPEDELLAKPIPNIKLTDDMTLEQALNVVSVTSGYEMSINWTLLARAGVNQRMLIPLYRFSADHSLRATLETVFAGVRADPPVAFLSAGGVVRISTTSENSRFLVTSIHNVRDIIDAYTETARPSDRPDSGPSRQEVIDLITRMIMDTIAPDTWRDAGGPIGAMREVMGLLVISQTPENQNAIARELDTLRKVSRMFPQTPQKLARPIAPGPFPASPPLEENDPLSKIIPSLVLDDPTTVDGALRAIMAASGCKIQVDWNGLEKPIQPRAPIQIYTPLTNVSVAKALTMVFTQAGAESDSIGFETDDGIIVVSTPLRLATYAVTRIYDVRDLDRAAGTFPTRILNGEPESLGSIICDSIAPHSWTTAGGSGTIHEFTGLMLVKQTPSIHREIERLLKALRETKAR